MDFNPASPLSEALFSAIVFGIVLLFLFSVYSAAQKTRGQGLRYTLWTGLGLTTYLGLFCTLVGLGTLTNIPMTITPLVFAFVNLTAIVLAFSPLGTMLAKGISIYALVAFQGFRLPLELILHWWGVQGTIPMSMTWDGQNFDIISGIVALLALPFVWRSPKVAWLPNLVGLLLLVNVGRVAMMSSPLPFAWGVEPPLLLIFFLPYALIAPVCVGGALAGHLILTRALLIKATNPSSDDSFF